MWPQRATCVHGTAVVYVPCLKVTSIPCCPARRHRRALGCAVHDARGGRVGRETHWHHRWATPAVLLAGLATWLD